MAVLVTDSTCDLTRAQLSALKVQFLPLRVSFGTESFLDKIEITDKAFYKRLAESSELPTTTLLSIGDYLECFEKFPNEEIVVLPLSSRLSGTYQSACAAAGLSKRKDIYVIDSMTVTGGLGLLVQKAAALRTAGKPAREIVAEIEAVKDSVRIFAMIDTLKYLVKGGRLSSVSGMVGGLLSIKPIVTVEDGEVRNISKQRGVPAAVNELVRLIGQAHPFDPAQPHMFLHTQNPAAVKQLARGLNLSTRTVPSCMIGSIVGTHVGPGAAGFCYFEKG